MTIREVLNRTDWALLAQQKLALLTRPVTREEKPAIDGLINWIDALQDAAENEGYPVIFLTDGEEEAGT